MLELLDEIIIHRLSDGTVHVRLFGGEDTIYRHGEWEEDDNIEEAILGALEYFFEESEDWNGQYH